MNKKDWYLILFLTPLVLVDYLSKKYSALFLEWDLGIVHFKEIFNRGVIFGSFSGMPDMLRVVGVSTVYGFIFFIFLIVQYLLCQKAYTFKTGLVIFFYGVTGNFIDRLIYGKVKDFILFSGFGHGAYIFNVADIFQWLGFFILIMGMIKERESIWFPENVRGKYLIDREYQLNFSMKLTFISLSTSIILGSFAFTYFKVSLADNPHFNQADMVESFLISYAALTLMITLMSFIIGIVFSHRTAGPLYGFKKFIKELGEAGGENLQGMRELHFRKADYHKELLQVSQDIVQLIKSQGAKK